MTRNLCFLLASSLTLLFSSCANKETKETHADRAQLADIIEKHARTEVLDKWYPQSVDQEDGGFLSTFTFDFKPTGPQDKMIVTQSRHIWSNSKAAELYPETAHYLTSAKHGFMFLLDKMWDKEF